MPETALQRGHWQTVWSRKAPDEMSWFEPVPKTSLELIEEASPGREAAILDVGGGASRLAAELVRRGYGDVTVADLSSAALDAARSHAGDHAGGVEWVETDVLEHRFGREFDLWHDRALMHFMVGAPALSAYVEAALRGVREGGHLVVSAFGPDGPATCSGLDVRRYSAAALAEVLAPGFEPVSSRIVEHTTPSGGAQQFLYAHLRRVSSS